jgi:catechol 2,3-dioxygenase-like lactoylglutathione lyase family enzyme
MGGQVALEAAAAVPGRVDAVIGVDSLHRLGVDPNPERLEPYVARFEDDYDGEMEAFIREALPEKSAEAVRRRILEDAQACAPEIAVSLMEHFGVHDPRIAATKIECRVVCINSDGAPTFVDENRALLTSFDATIMKGVGHWPHLEAPEEFLARLRAELARLGPREEEGVQALLQSLSPILYCEDVAAARAFYVDGLAFEETDRLPRDESLAPDFVALRRDGATVMLQSFATLRTDLPEVAARPRDGVLFLRVTNLDKELVRLGEDARIAVPERRLSSGSRQIVVEDRAGNYVVLQQPPAVPAR